MGKKKKTSSLILILLLLLLLCLVLSVDEKTRKSTGDRPSILNLKAAIVTAVSGKTEQVAPVADDVVAVPHIGQISTNPGDFVVVCKVYEGTVVVTKLTEEGKLGPTVILTAQPGGNNLAIIRGDGEIEAKFNSLITLDAIASYTWTQVAVSVGAGTVTVVLDNGQEQVLDANGQNMLIYRSGDPAPQTTHSEDIVVTTDTSLDSQLTAGVGFTPSSAVPEEPPPPPPATGGTEAT